MGCDGYLMAIFISGREGFDPRRCVANSDYKQSEESEAADFSRRCVFPHLRDKDQT